MLISYELNIYSGFRFYSFKWCTFQLVWWCIFQLVYTTIGAIRHRTIVLSHDAANRNIVGNSCHRATIGAIRHRTIVLSHDAANTIIHVEITVLHTDIRYHSSVTNLPKQALIVRILLINSSFASSPMPSFSLRINL